ncbi:sensor domain-containing protein [Pseudoalteromonas denitrificans]|uniref:cyclic-guanylate-specific phosphodiesterase n=1 Tax=Pseudoalteromonas denitrificans DSM 6059 TaxID=1123010 RepID=A0A1I1MJZ9_9GAMM|nr:bifunctional diguanylate cyclase/phosphodiesterase [Pseudoalteromonas denitrificans]SFC85757.1 EAL domain, c-di-GMP-specific phosphodiesterase class I (or its enzymatically inactive variant) [Pseudoalteromonas denitrificans DSM 6059]
MFINTSKFKSILFYLATMLFGLCLSVLVYLSLSKVEKSALLLVENEIPTLSQIKNVVAILSEQERLLYEYYAKDENNVYIRLHNAKIRELDLELIQLTNKLNDPNLKKALIKQVQKIKKTALELTNNLSSEQTQWQLAREQLAKITLTREAAIPHLNHILKDLNQRVDFGYQETKSELNKTSWTVAAFSLMLLVITLVVGRYMRGYLNQSAEITRLALFPMRNPNPIISLDDAEKIIYANPAAEDLLLSISREKGELTALLPKDIHAIIKLLKKQKKQILKIEHHLSSKVLSCEFHQLYDVNQVDVHIVDITEQKKAEDELFYQAFHDSITGLYNLNQLIKFLDSHFIDSPSHPFSMMMIEIRKFNAFMTSHGLDAAKELQVTVAKNLESCLSEFNLMCKTHLFQLNERSFACIIDNDNDLGKIQFLHEKIERSVKEPFMTLCGELTIELDFGVIDYPEHGKSPQELLKNGQAALEQAINIEHSSLVYYSYELGDKLSRQIQLIDALKLSIQNNKLNLHYQPQLHLNSKKIIGAETLCRWTLENKSISPAEFIPLAEQSGLIIPLGNWILKTACLQAKNWLDQDINLVIAVNISPRQFSQPNFVNLVKDTLKQSQLPAKNLELEITEGVLMHQETDTISMLEQLKQLGVQLSIDDFGTGYSSLSYLKKFPVDKLKIDQSFILDSHQSKEDRDIVQTIVSLGKNLGLSLIAEGVENQQHQDFLMKMDCDEIQGYFFSRPLPAKQFTHFYNQHLGKV